MLTDNQLREVAALCGRHTGMGSMPPQDEREREIWGLVEILDFDCFKYGDAPAGVTEANAKEYLLAHKDEFLAMTCDPPSFLGFASGVFDFLRSGPDVDESVEASR